MDHEILLLNCKKLYVYLVVCHNAYLLYITYFFPSLADPSDFGGTCHDDSLETSQTSHALA